ncbi:MAG: 23S rRNA (adenine(2503)-C(2))-methyltransferase RlmN [Anaerolineales bacterium]|nr:23S rRNA (adenine(2503)-C(2))-methyltransferase RlmN [Anaerolineales bacterium]
MHPTTTNSLNLYDLTYNALHKLLQNLGGSQYHTDQVWQQLYREGVTAVSHIPHIRADILDALNRQTHIDQLDTQIAIDSSDGFTRKFLLKLADGHTIETVLMQFKGRWTACVSTQVGCAMGCVFCATGQMGFTRHLTPGEIIAQVIYVNKNLANRGQQLRNIVLMGMGEPLHNYDNTMTAVDTLIDHKGMAIAPKHITLSTVGIVPGIIRLADEERPIRLAVSLHAATDTERQKLVPPAKRWPLAELMDACRYYTTKRNRNIFFEWTLIAGQNDGPDQADALGKLLTGMNAHVNLIPLNPTMGYNGRPTQRLAAKQFQAILTSYGIPSTVRQRRGIDIAAGCGQLKTVIGTW